MVTFPSGIVTFLMTDVEGSTRLWEEDAVAMEAAIDRHDTLVRLAVEANAGTIVKARGEGDSVFAVFERPADGVSAACQALQAIDAEVWPTSAPIRVRAAVHSGEARARDGDYLAPTVNRCARLRAIAHGGQLLVSKTVFDIVQKTLPASLTVKDLGEHRLRDLARPEHVFQLSPPGLEVDFLPVRSLGVISTNLPLQITSFVGRTNELVELRELLAHHRLVTLVGPGGIGKTRLALQCAAEFLDVAADGVFLAEFAAITESSFVPATVASGLGVRTEGRRAISEILVDHLQERSVLLVADACEHVLEACAPLIDALLKSCASLRVLATSQEPLGVSGEAVYRTPPLSFPSALGPATLEDLERSEAVRLFVERSTAARAEFRLTDSNAAAVAQICARLDGVPLALELAAARVRHLNARQIADRLDDRFRLLTGGSRSALPRQQTLRAALDWSYQMLSPPEAALLRRLSVFAGGWSLEAAEAVGAGVAEAADVAHLLGRLIDRSLVVAEEGSDTPRFRLLDTVRQYAQEKLLDAGEMTDARDRHLNWHLSFAERVTKEMRRGAIQPLAAMGAENDNFRAALEWARVLDDPPRLLMRLSGALAAFWTATGAEKEGGAWLAEAIGRSEGERSIERTDLLCATPFEFLHGQGMDHLREECLVLAREIGEPELVLRALRLRAGLDYTTARRDEVQASLAFVQEALQLNATVGNPWHHTTLQISLGRRYSRLGDMDLAEKHYLEARDLALRQGFTTVVADACVGLADLTRSLGQLQKAVGHDGDALQLWDELGYTAPAMRSRINLGFSLCATGRSAEARTHLAAALSYCLATGVHNQTVSLARVLAATAGVALAAGRVEDAARLLGSQLGPEFRAFPADLPDLRALRSAAIEALGEEAFACAYEAGVADSQAAAVALAESILEDETD